MNRQEIKNKLNRCCDIMRDDRLVPLQYIEQLSWLLFLKLFDDFEERRKIINPNHQFVFEEKYRWKSWANKLTGEELKEFIERDLIPYLSNLSGTPQKAKIASIFKGIKNHMMSGYSLAEVIEIINGIDLENPGDTQVLSIAYEELLMFTTGQGGGAGEFYTPRPIIRLMVKIIDPKIGEKILDPFCGSAGFLVEAYKYLIDKAKTLKEHKILQEQTFYGQELKPFPLIVGTLNAMLHGIESPNIIETNSFAEDLRAIPEDKKFDIILTNPPFGGDAAKRSLATFAIKTSDTELAGLYLCMKKLKTSGRCAIVQPEGVLFRTSGAYLRVKKELLENYNLHTIISLPQGVFANVSPKGGLGPKTNLLFFEKGKPTKEIWYYEVNPPPGMKNYTKTKPITDEDLKDVFIKWQKREISENSWSVKVEDIIKRDYDLSAKNPNKTRVMVYRKPEELVRSVLEKEKEIEKILREIKKEF
jgi:type I restriction enzyme M protein